MNTVFSNRGDAGQKLAQRLLYYTNNLEVIVLGLARGGVPVAYEIAKKLNLPLDVCLVKKLGLPSSPETAMGAISLYTQRDAPPGAISEGVSFRNPLGRHGLTDGKDVLLDNYREDITIIDQDTAKINRLQSKQIQAIAAKKKAELRWRESRYRNSRPMLQIYNRTVILVDDGMATGLTMHAAIEVLSQHQPAEIIIAIPVASGQAIAKVEHLVDDIICLVIPHSLGAVGFWYEDFSQTTDLEVCNLLAQQTDQDFVELC